MQKKQLLIKNLQNIVGKREIIRRYLKEKYEHIYNGQNKENYLKIEKIMNEYNIKIEDDLMIKAINMEKEKTGYEIAGIELKDGKVITGKEKEDITKTAGVILNILKIGTDCLIILTILSNKSGKIQKILGNLEKMKDLRYYSTSIIPEKERVFLKSLNIDILYNI